MSPTPSQYNLRTAESKDRIQLSRFLTSLAYTHRHLDWREPLDWLGRQPFLILEKNHDIEAVLACPADPPGVAWVRLFAVASRTSPSWTWNILFERALSWFSEQPERSMIVALGLQDWFGDLLMMNGFVHHQDIIVLSFDGKIPATPLPQPGLSLRPMQPSDLPAVTQVDNQAFEDIWCLSLDDLSRAYERSTYKTVMEKDGVVIGYQMSGVSGFNAHLARLAVDPAVQRGRIGFRLVQDVLHHFIEVLGTWGVTLNTQGNNQASLALYKKMGFRLTGDKFPVYLYNR
jgi:ribosomal protein S18 acetylase RimI-like enzyme